MWTRSAKRVAGRMAATQPAVVLRPARHGVPQVRRELAGDPLVLGPEGLVPLQMLVRYRARAHGWATTSWGSSCQGSAWTSMYRSILFSPDRASARRGSGLTG